MLLSVILSNEGLSDEYPQAQVLRNQIFGNTWTSAASAPLLHIVIFSRMSSAEDFAYSIKTSKYLFSLKTPVSCISYSGSFFPRRPFSSSNCLYGYSCCGYLYNIFRYECVGVASRK